MIRDGGTARQAAIESLVKSVGGTLETCYFGALGKDVFMVVDVPDEAAVTAVLYTVAASGVTEQLSGAPLDRSAIGCRNGEVARLQPTR